jgi:hypothetical protein
VKKILYLHELESAQGGEKVDFLAKTTLVHAPFIDYTRSDIFSFLVSIVEEFNPDYIIGSSMGGYAAFVFGALYDIPVLAFNPALHSRSFNPKFPKFVTKHIPDEFTIVVGDKDTIIESKRTLNWLKDHIKDNYVTWNIKHIKTMGHKVPLTVFTDMYNKIIK